MTKTENNLKKNFIWNIIGLTLYGIVSLFLMIIVKHINGLKISGIFSYAYSICTLFYFISLYYSRTYQIANYNNSKNFNQFLTFRLTSSLLSFVLIFIFSLVSGFDKNKIFIILHLMLFRVLDAISDTFYGYVQEKNELYKVGISYTLKSVLSILLFFIIDYYTKNIYLSIVSMNMVNLLFLIFYDINNYKKLCSDKFKFDFSNTKLILKESLPIFLFSFISSYLANAEKYVIVYFTTDEIQSIFAILIMPATVLSLVGCYLINPFINKLNELNKNKEYKKFNMLTVKILVALLLLGILGTLFCYLWGIPILNLIYKINLDKYRFELAIIIIASIMCAGSMILSNILTILNKNNLQFVFYFISAIVATASCYYFIKSNVISGSVYAYLLSYVVNFSFYIMYYIYIIKHIGGINEKK